MDCWLLGVVLLFCLSVVRVCVVCLSVLSCLLMFMCRALCVV